MNNIPQKVVRFARGPWHQRLILVLIPTILSKQNRCHLVIKQSEKKAENHQTFLWGWNVLVIIITANARFLPKQKPDIFMSGFLLSYMSLTPPFGFPFECVALVYVLRDAGY